QRVDAVVASIDINVVAVDQQPASGAGGDRGDELVFRNRGFGKGEVARHVFDEKLAAEKFLHGGTPCAYVIERFFRVGQRQQVVELPAGHTAPAQVLGTRGGCDAIGERL